MSVLGMVTGRLMETWAQGQDVADGLGVSRTPSDRLRHVATLAVRAQDRGYAVRGLIPPAQGVPVELRAPECGLWAFRHVGATATVSGPAEDFCLAATRRRHADVTDPRCQRDAAREWMEIGQAYAGPPGPDPVRLVARMGTR
jgi:uncharacterized protein (TIGR03084 family)